MAYTTKTISLTEIKKTDYIPDFVNIINSNHEILKSNILDLFNNLKINGSNIGDINNAISAITSNGVYVKCISDGSGIIFYNNQGNEIASITKDADGKINGILDSLSIRDTLNMQGDLVIGDETEKHNIEVNGTINLNGSFITTTNNSLIDAELDGNVAKINIILNENIQSDIVVNIKLSDDIFDISTNAFKVGVNKLEIVINNQDSIIGQGFNIILGDLYDSADTIKDGVILPTGGLFIKVLGEDFINNGGIAEYELIESSSEFIEYSKSLDIKILERDEQKVIYIKNI